MVELHVPRTHGHRGSRGTHAENTFSGFEEVLDIGAEVIELDVQLSGDNTLFVLHDPVLSERLNIDLNHRRVNPPVIVRELSDEQFSHYSVQRRGQDESFPIPTLDEVFHWASFKAKDVLLHVEIKHIPNLDHVELPFITRFPELGKKLMALEPSAAFKARKVLDLVTKYQLKDRVTLLSFDPNVLMESRKIDPGIKISLVLENLRENFSYWELAKKLAANVVSPHFGMVTAESVALARELALEVVPYTVNDAKDWTFLRDVGVDGIVTDFPRELFQFLRRRSFLAT